MRAMRTKKGTKKVTMKAKQMVRAVMHGLGAKAYCVPLLFCGMLCASPAVLRAQTTTPTALLKDIPHIRDNTVFKEPNLRTGVVLREYAQLVGGSRCFRVTQEKKFGDEEVGAGYFWFKQKLNLKQHNMLSFTVFAGANDDGGDGMAFVMHNDEDGFDAYGDTGGSLRYAYGGPTPDEPIIEPSLAIEIDTYQNPACNGGGPEPAYDHLAMVENGRKCLPIPCYSARRAGSAYTVMDPPWYGSVAVRPQVKLGTTDIEKSDLCLNYVVVWQYHSSTSQTLALYVDGVLRLWKTADFIDRIFGGESNVFIGFTGSTGGATNEQTVCIGRKYETNPSAADDTFDVPANRATGLAVIANDQALNVGGREVFATAVTVPPENGTATVQPGTGNKIQKKILYTPNYGYFGTDTFTYQVCDSPVSGFCYSKCTTAEVTVEVGCPVDKFNVKKGADHRCIDSLSPTGHARAEVKVNQVQDFFYTEDFSTYSLRATRGTRTQAIDNSTTSFSVEQQRRYYTPGVRKTGQDRRLLLSRFGDYYLNYVLTPVDIAATDTLRFRLTFGVIETGFLRVDLTVERRDEDGALQKITAVGSTKETLKYDGLYYGGQRVTRVYKIPRSDFGRMPAAGTPATRWGFRIDLDLNARNTYLDKDMWIDDLVFNFGKSRTKKELTGDYDISWYEGELTEIQLKADPQPQAVRDALLGTGIVRQALGAGRYTVYAEYKADDKCGVEPKTFTIARSRKGPSVTIDTSDGRQDSNVVTSCTTPNGQLRAYVDPGDGSQIPPADDSENIAAVSATGYAFNWVRQGSTTSISPLPRLKDVGQGSYDVTVTHSASGCSTTKRNIRVGGNVTRPQVVVSRVNHITSCGSANPMGSAKARARVRSEDSWSRDAAVWEFEWFQGAKSVAQLSATPFKTGHSVNLPAGTYTVRSKLKSTSCVSGTRSGRTVTGNLAEFTINSSANAPVVKTPTVVSNNHCGSPFGGSIAVSAKNPGEADSMYRTSGFSFKFYEGADTTDTTKEITSTDATGSAPYLGRGGDLGKLFHLNSGTYSLVVTDTGSSCSTVVSPINVGSATDGKPSIDGTELTIADNTSCTTTFNGSLTIGNDAVKTGGNVSPGGYEYTLTAPSDPTFRVAQTDNKSFTGLKDRIYSLVAKDLTTGCSSDAHAFTVQKSEAISSISTLVDDNTSCDPDAHDGSISVTADLATGATVTEYTFRLKSGHSYGTTDAEETSTSATYAFTGLSPKSYRVEVEDEHGCSPSALFRTVADVPARPRATATATDNSSCDSSNPNGSVEVSVTGVTDLTGYAFVWYLGSVSGTPLQRGTPAVNRNLNEETGLEAGRYVIKVTAPNACEAVPAVSARVSNDRTIPSVRIEEPAGEELTACIEAEADGSLEAVMGTTISGATYEWYEGNTAGTAGSGFAHTKKIENRWRGDYTVRVTAGGCETTASYSLTSRRVAPTLTSRGTEANTHCGAPWNGSFQASLEYPSGTAITDLSGFTFGTKPVGPGSFTDVTPTVDSGNVVVGGLATGRHRVRVTRKGCQATVTTPIVQDSPANPAITDPRPDSYDPRNPGNEQVLENTACVAEDHNGQITLSPDSSNDADAASNYSYEWYEGSSSSDVDDRITGATRQLGSLSPGTYTAKVTHKASKCVSEAQYLVTDGSGNLATDPLGRPSTDPLTTCNPNDGFLEVTIDGMSDASAGDLEWKWYKGVNEDLERTRKSLATELSNGDKIFSWDTQGIVISEPKPGDGKIDRLPAGHYGFEVRDIRTGPKPARPGCVLPYTTFSVGVGPDVPIVATPAATDDPSGYSAPSTCSDSGWREITISPAAATPTRRAGTPPSKYVVTVYDLDVEDPASDPSANVLATQDVTSGAATRITVPGAGNHRAVVENFDTKCTVSVPFAYPFANAPAVVNVLDVDHSRNCRPYADDSGVAGSGGATGSVVVALSIRGDGTTSSALPYTQDEYMLFLYKGEDISPKPDMRRIMSRSGQWLTSELPDGEIKEKRKLVQGKRGINAPTTTRTETYDPNDTPGDTTDDVNVRVGRYVDEKGTPGDTTDDEYVSMQVYEFEDLAGDNGSTEEGKYSVIAALIGENGCESEKRLTPSLDNEQENPAIDFTSTADIVVTSNTSCGVSSSSNGAVQLLRVTRGTDADTGSDLIDDYDLEWYESRNIALVADDPATPFDESTRSTKRIGTPGVVGNAVAENHINQLPIGTYGLRVKKINDDNGGDGGCFTDFAVTISNNTERLAIEGATSVDVTSCNTPNGSVAVGDVDVDIPVPPPADRNGPFTGLADPNYVVDMYKGSSDTPVATLASDDTNIENGLDEGTYRLVFRNTATQCKSPPFSGDDTRVEIDGSMYPRIDEAATRTGIVAHTNCATPDGSIPVTLDDPSISGDVTYVWSYEGTNMTDGADPGNGSSPTGVSTSTVGGLVGGANYKVESTHGTSGCESEATFAVSDGRAYPTMHVSDLANIKPDELCTGDNGEIVVPRADVRPDGPDYVVRRYATTGTANLLNSDSFTPTDSRVVFTGLSSGKYYLRAYDSRPDRGCESLLPLEVEVKESLERPVLLDVQTISDKGCTVALDVGEVKLTVADTDANRDRTPDDFAVLVEAAGGPVSATVAARVLGVASTVHTATGLSAATSLPVRVTNQSSGCVTPTAPDTFVVSVGKEEPEFSFVSPSDDSQKAQKNCSPADGAFRVLELKFNGESITQPLGTASVYEGDDDFVFTWKDAADEVLPDPPVGSMEEYERTDLSSGGYKIMVEHTASGCQLETDFMVRDETKAPLVFVSQESADKSCTGGAADGELKAEVEETGGRRDDAYDGDGRPGPDYEFAWYEGDDVTVSPPRGEGSTLSAAAAGDYTVRVKRESTGCVSTAPIELSGERFRLELSLALPETRSEVIERRDTKNVKHKTNCTPPNGAIEFADADVSPGDLSDYDAFIYEGSPGLDSSIAWKERILGGAPVRFSGLEDEAYFVRFRHKDLKCDSDIYQVVVPEKVVKPGIRLTAATSQSNCDPTKANGALEISADGSKDEAKYGFEWFLGASTVVSASKPMLEGASAGSYRVKVTSKDTGCIVEGSYVLNDIAIGPVTEEVKGELAKIGTVRKPLELEVSLNTPDTHCSGAGSYNGFVSVRLKEMLPEKKDRDYGFLWEDGRTVPGETSKEHDPSRSGLKDGEYSVLAYYKEDKTCRSAPIRVVVRDGSQPPVVKIKQNKLLTNCVPVAPDTDLEYRPNAEIEAWVSRGIPPGESYLTTHSFKLYKTDISGSKKELDAPVASGLDVGSYVAEATHNTTRCVGRTEVDYKVQRFPKIPPPPRVSVDRNQTHCSEPNGKAVAASIEASPYYRFHWYLEEDGGRQVLYSENKGAPENLKAGRYLVYNTDEITACRSQVPTRVDIYNSVRQKEFRVETTASYCSRPSGTARVVPVDPFDVASAVWTRLDTPTGEQELSKEVELLDAPPGKYRLNGKDRNECSFEKEFEIGYEVVVYNGLSPNGDGMNDFLMLDCVDKFPDNVVRVYDRDGNLVFQVRGYDNEDSVFRGEANTGTALGGSALADGTYYYVIDKGNGASPMVGFMELIR